METFKHDIELLIKTFNEETKGWDHNKVKKTATFKELNQLDKDQHKLHFKLISLVKNMGTKEDVSPEISPDDMYDITVKFIKQMLLIDQAFNAQDREEFLLDSAALFTFGLWLMDAKLAPFFLILTNFKEE